jgi:hypothetical protein
MLLLHGNKDLVKQNRTDMAFLEKREYCHPLPNTQKVFFPIAYCLLPFFLLPFSSAST